MPKISAIIPVFNAAEYVKEAVDSALAQSYKDLEIIVVDDGSTDGSGTVIKSYGEAVRYIRQEHKGVSAARNLGIRNSLGSYIAFLDADDIWLKDKLEKQIHFLEANADAGLAVCDAENFDENGAVLGTYFKRAGVIAENKVEKNAFKEMVYGNFCPLSGVMIRKECFVNTGFFDEKLIFAEDYDLFVRVSAHYGIGIMPDILAKRRFYDKRSRSSMTIASDLRKEDEIYILEKINKTFPELVRKYKVNINGLESKAYFKCGYEHFMKAEYEKARSDFGKSVRRKLSFRAAAYYLATFLNDKVIYWIRKLKNP